ncbi:MAG: hypothetical protein D6761_13895 [Candidatus Dadabacteria bacterium]|nr:MAG: hypothetical protein D6761_13895 [Candidatus Dadabacteria bacterium]
MSTLGLVIDDRDYTAVLFDPETGQAETRQGPLAELDALSEWQRQSGARCAAILDAPMYFRRLTFPFAQPRKIRQVLPLQLDEHLPGPPEDFERHVMIGTRDGEGVADVLLVPARDAAQARSALLDAGILPRTMEPLGLVLADQAEPGQAVVLVGEWRTTIAWSDGNDASPSAATVPLGAGHLQDSAARANLAVRIVAMLPDDARHVALIGDASSLESLTPLLTARGIEVDPRVQADARHWLATFAARDLVGRRRPVWNLAPRRPLISPEIVQSGILQQVAAPFAALLVMIAVTVITGNHALLAEAGAARAEINEIYRRNFPDSRIVDPLRQMQAVVERAGTARTESEHMPVLQSLVTLHKSLPDDVQFQIDELRSGDGTWLLRGLADDYGTVDRIKAAAESVAAFRNVRVQRAEQTLDKAHVRFTLSWEEAG